jgi:predicted Na+-dependent transporter
MKIGSSLAIGLLVRACLSGLAAKVQPFLSRSSILSLALLITLLLITNMQNVLSLYGTGEVLASILFVAVGSGTDGCCGGRQSDT